MKKVKTGEPAIGYSHQMGVAVFRAMSVGKALASVEGVDGIPNLDTLLEWANKEPDFCYLIALAKQERLTSLIEEVRAIADNADQTQPAAVEKARLQCEVRMWLAGELAPVKRG